LCRSEQGLRPNEKLESISRQRFTLLVDGRNPARLNVALQRRRLERSIIQSLLDNLRLRIAGAVGEGASLQWQNAAPAKGL